MSVTVDDNDLPGVDLPRLTTWLDERHPGLADGPLSGSMLTGGKSNLTYRITDGTQQWAMRRPPLAHVLPTAHDMAREYRVISALADTDVAVPQPVALCEDADVLGAPFYLMGFVDGVVLDRPDVLASLTPDKAARSCHLLMATLAALHEINPAEVGLGEFGRPTGFLARQIKRWHQQWQASETEHRADLDAVVERLSSTLPEQSAPGIVHGDYRLTNVMFDHDVERIAAVVDWEMATVGDPLTDVGLNVVYQDIAQRPDDSAVMPSLAPERGFLSAQDMTDAYARASSRDLGELDWYVGLGYFKLAVISEGIHHRYLAGKTVGEGFEKVGARVPTLLADALTHLEGR